MDREGYEDRKHTPAGDTRKQQVRCICGAMTMNLSAVCDDCTNRKAFACPGR